MTRGIARRIVALLAMAVLLLFTAPGLMAAAADPIRDLAEAVAYWQEQAVVAAVERDKAREELARVTAERDALLQDRATLEEIVGRLQSERNEALSNGESEASLRRQAERDLEVAIGTIKSLQEALNRLAGPRFGVILGATYSFQSRDPALLAGLQLTFR
jgi:hypothetical protein